MHVRGCKGGACWSVLGTLELGAHRLSENRGHVRYRNQTSGTSVNQMTAEDILALAKHLAALLRTVTIEFAPQEKEVKDWTRLSKQIGKF